MLGSTMVPPEPLKKRLFKAAMLDGEFRLRSGVVANVYFGKYLFEANPQLLREVAIVMTELVPSDTDALAGLELGGIPIAIVMAQETGLHTFFVRKRAKPHGTCKQIGGVRSEVSGPRRGGHRDDWRCDP
jgi:orotate phosphoribosyltransferase